MRYPTGIKKEYHATNSHANRGMTLESEINESNDYYLNSGRAVIYKKPTPITISKVDYPSRIEAVIREAYFRVPSTTDYNGIYRGKYIDFEAKETKLKNYFPINNIHSHQIKHLKRIMDHGGIGFIIVRFTSLNETYLLMVDKLLDFLDTSARKSIPLEYFRKWGYIIKDKYSPRVDYLEIIDNIYFDGGNIWKRN